MDPVAILTQIYPVGSATRELLLHHGELVARKARAILERAGWLAADTDFVYQAAMLHDIGIGATRSPKLGCTGTLPYLCHGIEGRAILDRLGFSEHALVCERHVGVGISAEQIVRQMLPLPARDMLPLSIEERLICYADKFFSKTDNGQHEKAVDEIVDGLRRFGKSHVTRFQALHRMFTDSPDPPLTSCAEPISGSVGCGPMRS